MRPNQRLLSLWTAASDQYAASYVGSPAQEYMVSRGLDSMAERFKIGYVVEPAPGHDDRYKGMLSIPYLTPNGTVGFKFRHIDGREPKYLAPAGQRQHMFNVQAVLDAVNYIVVVEGELDAIAAESVGIPAVGISGSNAWRSIYSRCFDGISKVIVCTDNDDKQDGSNPGQELARKISDNVSQSIRVSLPIGQDVNSTILNQGADYFTNLVGSV